MITVSLLTEPHSTLPLNENGVIVKVTSRYWYITFFIIKELEPVDEFMSIELSANLASLYATCFVPGLAYRDILYSSASPTLGNFIEPE